MRIENYLGFPTGVSGAELTDRAVLQANKFGACLSVPTRVTRLCFENGYAILEAAGAQPIVAKCLLIATGAQYRRLNVEGCERYEGLRGHSGRGFALPGASGNCGGRRQLAGQAAVFLAGHASRVFLAIRSDDLNKNMSNYLVRRIEQTANIDVLRNTAIQRVNGNGHLESVDLVVGAARQERTLETPAVFSFIGVTPRTDWLPAHIERDAKGFVTTGPALAQSPQWKTARMPFLLETSQPGVFAAGDVRSGSVKRVASAVGEGAMSVQFVHEYLKEM
jgi:thioredoxin reductase (NADPH)